MSGTRAMIAAAVLSVVIGAADAAAPVETGLAGTGEQELPKVLYVVPWKDAPPGEPVAPPAIQPDESFFAPLDRDIFQAQLQYRAGVTPSTAEKPAPNVR